MRDCRFCEKYKCLKTGEKCMYETKDHRYKCEQYEGKND